MNNFTIFLQNFRYLFFLLFMAWTYFAIFENNPNNDRIAAIDNFYLNKIDGGLNKSDKIFMEDLIQFLISITDSPSLKWKFNRPISKNILNINVVSSEIYKHTYTSRGNAVYDSELDAIFIHENLVKGVTSIDDGTGNKFPTGWTDRKIYLSFIILHELGHRFLHAESAALFDELIQSSSVSDAKRREIEADNFALQSLGKAYKYDLEIGKKFLPKFSDEDYAYITNSEGELKRDYNIILGFHLAGFIEEWLVSEIKSGDFSPYHYDRAHPNLAFRLRSIVSNIDENKYHNRSKNSILRAKDIITRIDAISERLTGQVEFPFQTVGVVLGPTKIWGLSELGNWASAEFSAADRDYSSNYVKIQALPDDTLPKIPLQSGAHVLGMVGDEYGPAIVVDNRRYVYIRTASRWKTVKLDAGTKPDVSLVYRSIFPIYARQGDKILGALVISMRDEQPKQMLVVHLIKNDGSVRERSADNMVPELVAEFGAIESELTKFGSTNYDTICLALYGRNHLGLYKLRGAVALNHDLVIQRTYELPDTGMLSDLHEATALCPRDKDRLVIIGSDYKTSGFQIWDVVFSKGKFLRSVLRGRILHLGERLEGRDYDQPSFSFLSAELYGQDEELHVVLRDDGYFVVNTSGETRILFHPGGLANGILEELVAIRPGYRGNNVYLVQNDRGTVQFKGKDR